VIKSPATLWRDTQMEMLRRRGLQYKQIGPLFGISGCRVAQCLEKRALLRRRARKAFAEFKAEQCFVEMRIIKRAYDQMSEADKAANKARMAAELDVLIAHRASAEAYAPA